MDRLVREYKRLKIIVALEREHLWNILINSRRPIETRRHLAKEIEIYERVIVLCDLLVEAYRLIRIRELGRAKNRYNQACNTAVRYFELEGRFGTGLKLRRQCIIIHRDFDHLNLD